MSTTKERSQRHVLSLLSSLHHPSQGPHCHLRRARNPRFRRACPLPSKLRVYHLPPSNKTLHRSPVFSKNLPRFLQPTASTVATAARPVCNRTRLLSHTRALILSATRLLQAPLTSTLRNHPRSSTSKVSAPILPLHLTTPATTPLTSRGMPTRATMALMASKTPKLRTLAPLNSDPPVASDLVPATRPSPPLKALNRFVPRPPLPSIPCRKTARNSRSLVLHCNLLTVV